MSVSVPESPSSQFSVEVLKQASRSCISAARTCDTVQRRMEEESTAGPSTAPAVPGSAPSSRHQLSVCYPARDLQLHLASREDLRNVAALVWITDNVEIVRPLSYKEDLSCTYTLGYKARPKRDPKPASISPTQVAERIDYIAERVDRLCLFLEDAGQTSSLGETAKAHASVSPTPNDHGTTASESWQGGPHDDSETSPYHEEEIQYKGDSSLAAHADFTTRVLETALNDSLLHPRPQEVDSIMATIRSTARPTPSSSIDVQDTSNGKRGQRGPQPSLPPVQLTLQCLRLLKENKLLKFFWLMAFESVGQVTDHLLNLYSIEGQPSTPELIITYVGLHSLFFQCSMIVTDAEVGRQYASEAGACRDNVERILANLPMHLPTTVDCVLALTMATEYCLGQCKPVTGWTYVSTASRMSQSLGLHRVASRADVDSNAETRQMSKLYWSLYILEKSLALQLGRSSTLRDHDITVSPRNVRLGFQGGGTLGILAPQWLQLSQIEGRVYDELYSPQALCQEPETRRSRARHLANEVQRITENLDPLDANFLRERRCNVGDRMDDVLIRCDQISRLSLICLIYRSMSVDSSTFCDECISTARQVLKEHSETMNLIGTNNVYLLDVCIHWGLLSSTCVPFFVVLCHAIWTLDATDLQLLSSLVDSMEAGQDQLPISASHLLKTFKPLHAAAVRYIRLKVDAASDAMADSVSFEAIYGEMAPEMAFEMTSDLFPMQWPALSTLPSLDQMIPFAVGGGPSGSTGFQNLDGFDPSSQNMQPGFHPASKP